MKLAITLVLAGLIVAATPVLASSSGQGLKPITGYTGKIENRVLSDTAAGRETSIVINLRQQADLSAAYGMRDQDAQGWYVYRTLKRTADRTQAPIKALLKAQGVSYKSFWAANTIVAQSADRALVQSLAARADVKVIESNKPSNWLEADQSAIAETSFDSVSMIEALRAGSHRAGREPGQGPERLGAGLHRHRDRDRQPGHRHALDAQRAQAALPRLERVKRRPQLQLVGLHPLRRRDLRAEHAGAVRRQRPRHPHDRHDLGDDGPGTRSAWRPERSGSAAATWTRGTARRRPTPSASSSSWPHGPPGAEPESGAAAARDEQQLGAARRARAAPPNTLQTIVENTQAAGIFVEASAGNAGPSCSTVQDPPAIYEASFSTGALDHRHEPGRRLQQPRPGDGRRLQPDQARHRRAGRYRRAPRRTRATRATRASRAPRWPARTWSASSRSCGRRFRPDQGHRRYQGATQRHREPEHHGVERDAVRRDRLDPEQPLRARARGRARGSPGRRASASASATTATSATRLHHHRPPATG